MADHSSCSLSLERRLYPNNCSGKKTLGSFLAPYFLTPNDQSISKSYWLILQNVFRILPFSPSSPWSSHHCLSPSQLQEPPSPTGLPVSTLVPNDLFSTWLPDSSFKAKVRSHIRVMAKVLTVAHKVLYYLPLSPLLL